MTTSRTTVQTRSSGAPRLVVDGADFQPSPTKVVYRRDPEASRRAREAVEITAIVAAAGPLGGRGMHGQVGYAQPRRADAAPAPLPRRDRNGNYNGVAVNYRY